MPSNFCRLHYRLLSRPAASLCPLFLLVTITSGGLASAARAEGEKGDSAFSVPADIQKTLDQIGDIDFLAALTPLKLTPSQLDRLLEPVNALAKESAVRRKKDYEIVRALADDVAKERANLLAGQPLDPVLASRIDKTNADMEARFASTQQDAAERVADVLKDALNEDQMTQIEARFAKFNDEQVVVPANLRNNASATKKYLHDQAMLWFGRRFFLPERAPDVLNAMKLSTSAAAPAASIAPATAVSAPPVAPIAAP